MTKSTQNMPNELSTEGISELWKLPANHKTSNKTPCSLTHVTLFMGVFCLVSTIGLIKFVIEHRINFSGPATLARETELDGDSEFDGTIGKKYALPFSSRLQGVYSNNSITKVVQDHKGDALAKRTDKTPWTAWKITIGTHANLITQKQIIDEYIRVRNILPQVDVEPSNFYPPRFDWRQSVGGWTIYHLSSRAITTDATKTICKQLLSLGIKCESLFYSDLQRDFESSK
jgi:hypothetical protein